MNLRSLEMDALSFQTQSCTKNANNDHFFGIRAFKTFFTAILGIT